MRNNIVVSCKQCGTADTVGPGHPATRVNPETGQHELYDVNQLRHQHDDDCQPDETGRRPLHFMIVEL